MPAEPGGGGVLAVADDALGGRDRAVLGEALAHRPVGAGAAPAKAGGGEDERPRAQVTSPSRRLRGPSQCAVALRRGAEAAGHDGTCRRRCLVEGGVGGEAEVAAVGADHPAAAAR
jgi:hypothetical protein